MTATIREIDARRDELTAWRRDLHAHPELAYAEHRTAGFVAAELRRAGLDVDVGLARTGIVATLTTGPGPAIALRADMDALPMQEANDFAHRSRCDGTMHACGHDGHTVMLLAAAQHLAQFPDFEGTVRFIFQPAEEAAGGAQAMIDEGLFQRFPVERVYGMHNWPGLPDGHFAMRAGPIMASIDAFDAVITGRGTHGALPHHGIDAVHVFAQTVVALQSIVSRNVDPLKSAVVSVTKMRGGDAHNILPEAVQFGGSLRAFEPAVRSDVKARVQRLIADVAASFGASADVRFPYESPPVVNDAESVRFAALAAARVVGHERVSTDAPPVLGSEDFARMLERVPGCYVFVGNGDGPGGCMIHDPRYDFNDAVLPIGAAYWVRLAEIAVAALRTQSA